MSATKKKAATKKTAAKAKSSTSKVPSKTFQAIVPAEGETLVARLPFDVEAVFGKARPPVIITVDGYQFPSTIMVYGGESFVGVRRSHRKAAGLVAGHVVSITVTLDTAPRVVKPPADLASALKKNAAALAAWKALSFTHQREHAEALEDAKKPETRARRLDKTIAMLLAKKR